MADVLVYAEVLLWEETVGAVVEMDDGQIVFEYAEDFRRSGLEISPVHLPTSVSGPVRFDELRRMDAFQGLPGVLADALPDAFGKEVIRSYYTSRGEEEKAFSPVQNLLYVADRAIGALEFYPPEELALRSAEAEALEVAELVGEVRKILSGNVDVALHEIYRMGSSAGGARPKALVLWNRQANEVRSAFAPRQEGDVPFLLKFDGVGGDATESGLGESQPYNRVEAAYSAMARDAGIDGAPVELLEGDEGHAHLLIRRFDRDGEEKIHQHTLGGLLHVDYNRPGASSYEEFLRTILRLEMPHAAVLEGYRRMLFNIVAVNQDDHVKNLSFHLDRTGTWSLAPAYDLTFAKGRGWTAEHQMRLAGRRSGMSRNDLLAVGEAFGIRAPARLLDQVEEVVARWPDYAEDFGVEAGTRQRIKAELEARREELKA